MKISYIPKYHPTEGTVYRQTISIAKEENAKLFNGEFNEGINYGNAYTGNYVSSKIFGLDDYKKQLKRIIVANSVVLVK